MGKARVLVVEDERIVARDIKQRLEAMGYAVVSVASTGIQAILEAERHRPDLVLMDIVLNGGVDGVEAAQRITETFDIPVIYLTAYTDEETLQKVKLTEPFAYIVKPFTDQSLRINIEIALHKHRLEQALRRSEERFRTLTLLSPAGVYLADAEGHYKFVNPRWSEMTGISMDDALGRGWEEGLFAEDRNLTAASWYETVKQGMKWSREHRLQDRKGNVRWVLDEAVPLRDKDGRVTGYIGTQADITAHKELEAEIRRDRERLEAVTSNIGAGLAIISKDSRIIWANRVLTDEYGDVRGRICYQTYGQRKAACPRCGVMEIFLTGKDSASLELETKDKNGNKVWYQIVATPLRGPKGVVESVLELVVPITERKRAEEAVRESEERFRRLVGSSFEGVVIHGPEGILDFNPRFSEMVGKGPEELIGLSLSELVAPEERESARKSLLSDLSGSCEFSLVRKDGSRLQVQAISREIPYEGRRVRVSALRDISDRMEVERLLKEKAREELYGFVVSALPLIAPGAYQEVRTELLRTFAERFERYFKPKFEHETAGAGTAGAPTDGRCGPALEVYLRWVTELFRSFGTDPTCSRDGSQGTLALHKCPWIEYSKNNPVFCLLCQTMASRSFSWASHGGVMGVRSTIAGGGKHCLIEFRCGWVRSGRGR
ncbi:MAG: PAS domain S-box protein [Thermoplasmatota archaeon]